VALIGEDGVEGTQRVAHGRDWFIDGIQKVAQEHACGCTCEYVQLQPMD
jgi:hypothetical protein